MIKTLELFIIIAVAGAVICAGTAIAVGLAGHRGPTVTSTAEQDSLPVIYYDPINWQNGQRLASQAATVPWPTVKISGAIIPHDILHQEYAVDVIQHLATQNVSTLVIIGPNHYERGAVNIHTADIAWTTPKGTVNQDQVIIKKLLDDYGIQSDPTVIQGDHSVTGIMPVIAQYLPNVCVVPLLLKAETSNEQIASLAKGLYEMLPGNSAVIASVDFSHYLTGDQAAANDKKTATILTELNSTAIMSIGPSFNNYVDSPPSIALFLELMKNNQANRSTILANTNSGYLVNSNATSVTSYFEMVYYK
jgi:AmmeMemoRadiSam system protein B